MGVFIEVIRNGHWVNLSALKRYVIGNIGCDVYSIPE